MKCTENNSFTAKANPEIRDYSNVVKPEFFLNFSGDNIIQFHELNDYARDTNMVDGDTIGIKYCVTGVANFKLKDKYLMMLDYSPKYQIASPLLANKLSAIKKAAKQAGFIQDFSGNSVTFKTFNQFDVIDMLKEYTKLITEHLILDGE